MSFPHNYIRNAVQGYNFDPIAFYAQTPYGTEGRATIDDGMTATHGYYDPDVDYGNANFNHDVIYGHNPYDTEGGATIAYGQTATDGYYHPDAAYGNGSIKVEDSYPDPSAFGVQNTQFDNYQGYAQPVHYDGFVDPGTFPVYASGPAPADGYGPPDQQMNLQQAAEDDESEDQATGRSSNTKEREIRDSPVGPWLEYRANNSSPWSAALRHHDIRAHLLQEADQIANQYGGYDVEPAKGIDAVDRTAFVPEHKTWGPARADRPSINFIFRKPQRAIPQHIQPKSQPTPWIWNGYIVLDHEDNPMRWFDDCPTTLASPVEGFRLDAIQKRNPQLQTKDLLGRLPRQHTVSRGSYNNLTTVSIVSGQALNNVAMRWRWDAGILSWSRRANADGTQKFLEQFLTAEQITRNNTRGGRDLTKKERDELVGYKKHYKWAKEQGQPLPNPPRRIPHVERAAGNPKNHRPKAVSKSRTDSQTLRSQQVDQKGQKHRSYGSELTLTHPFGPPGMVLPSNPVDLTQTNGDQLGGAKNLSFTEDGSSPPLDLVDLGTSNRRKRRHAEVITLDDDESSPSYFQRPTLHHENVQSVGPVTKKRRLDAEPLPKPLKNKSHRQISARRTDSRKTSKREETRAGPQDSRARKSSPAPDNGIFNKPASGAEDSHSRACQVEQQSPTPGREIEVPPGFEPVFFPVGAATTLFATTNSEISFGFIEADDKTRWETLELSVAIKYLQDLDAQQDDEPGVRHTMLNFESAPDQLPREVSYRISSREGYGFKIFPVGAVIFCYSTKDRAAFAGQVSPYDSMVWNQMSWGCTIGVLESMEKRRLDSLQDASRPQGHESHAVIAPLNSPIENVDATSPTSSPAAFRVQDATAPAANTTPPEQGSEILSPEQLMMLWDELDGADAGVTSIKFTGTGEEKPASPGHADAMNSSQPHIGGENYGNVDGFKQQVYQHGTGTLDILNGIPVWWPEEIVEKEYFDDTHDLGLPTAETLFAPPPIQVDLQGPQVNELEVNKFFNSTYDNGHESPVPWTIEELIADNKQREYGPVHWEDLEA